MKTKVPLLVTLFIILNVFVSSGKTYNNEEFRFSIDIPTGCTVKEINDKNTNLLLTAKCDTFVVKVYAYKAQKNYYYDFKKIVDFLATEESDSMYVNHDPWTNLLRNEITLSGKKDETYIDRLITFRARTLFDIQIYSTACIGSVKEEILDSIDLDLTIYSKLQLLKSSISIILLILFPTLYFNIFYFLGLAFRKYKNSRDSRWLMLTIVLFIIVLTLTILSLYFLRQDITFAIIFTAFLLGLGICIMTRNEFLTSFAKSIIS